MLSCRDSDLRWFDTSSTSGGRETSLLPLKSSSVRVRLLRSNSHRFTSPLSVMSLRRTIRHSIGEWPCSALHNIGKPESPSMHRVKSKCLIVVRAALETELG